jgi:hypothetical protein
MMDRRLQRSSGLDAPRPDQRLVDEIERRRVAAYVSATSVLRLLHDAVEDAARRADALQRLDVALRLVPLS